MKIDKEDPIIISISTLIISFFIILSILYLFSPNCVLIINPITGKVTYSWNLIIIYSFSLSLLVSIFIILISCKNRKLEKITNFEINDNFPSSITALAYL